MVQKKNVKKASAAKARAAAPVAKEEKACSCGCAGNCSCGTKGVLLGSIIIAAAIFAAPIVNNCPCKKGAQAPVPAAAPAAPVAAPSEGGCGAAPAAPAPAAPAAPRAARAADPAMVKEIVEDKTNTILSCPLCRYSLRNSCFHLLLF